jgi:hypothetical protein
MKSSPSSSGDGSERTASFEDEYLQPSHDPGRLCKALRAGCDPELAEVLEDIRLSSMINDSLRFLRSITWNDNVQFRMAATLVIATLQLAITQAHLLPAHLFSCWSCSEWINVLARYRHSHWVGKDYSTRFRPHPEHAARESRHADKSTK